MIPKCRIYCYETQEMIVANDYEELSELFMALNTDSSIFSEPMQSTGLFDNSTPKKEIFGNDIVEWKHNGTGRLIRGIVKRDVDFDFWGVQVCRFDDLTPFGHLANQRVTVLGNVYENKEGADELK